MWIPKKDIAEGWFRPIEREKYSFTEGEKFSPIEKRETQFETVSLNERNSVPLKERNTVSLKERDSVPLKEKNMPRSFTKS